MAACKDGDLRVRGISSAIRVVPNFPKPGIMFQDITTLLLDPKAFRDAIDIFVDRYKDKEISVVAGLRLIDDHYRQAIVDVINPDSATDSSSLCKE
uniref:adenine phosphoribosyltransferase n=1 Tax=Picea sitchensis TaxID=3332 RepID=B8LNM5_PICSI|nr:unknown [Picea sitchensis]